MDTVVLNRANSAILVTFAETLDKDKVECAGLQWKIARSNPMIQWIGGNFVEGDKANSNGQFWTSGDLELAEYTIRYSPLNLIHEWKQPLGFFADTRTVKLDRHLSLASVAEKAFPGAAPEEAATGSMKIQVLAGLWQHIFPREAAMVASASREGQLALSMECIGSHLRCAGPKGCGKEFAYSDVDTHCEHLKERASIRHIVNPVFRGGAIIVPPAKPGWKGASAEVLSTEIMKEAAAFAEHTEQHYEAASETRDITTTQWEQLMALVIAAHEEK